VARLESYQKLQREQAFQLRQQDQRAQLEQKRRFKILMKNYNKNFKRDQ
jgi:ribosome biogenesis GTPase